MRQYEGLTYKVYINNQYVYNYITFGDEQNLLFIYFLVYINNMGIIIYLFSKVNI